MVDSPFDVTTTVFSNFTADYDCRIRYIGNNFYHGERTAWFPNSAWPLIMTPTAAPTGWMASLVASTNPSRPVVTPFTLIQNLVELPRMILQLGRILGRPSSVMQAQGAASAYLGIKFGWLPLIDDLRKLLDLQRYTLIRAQELYRLYTSESGLRRRIRFGESNVATDVIHNWALLPSVNGITRISVVDKRVQWGTIRWHPTGLPPFSPNDLGWHNLARRLVTGMTPEGLVKGLWDVIPWTWMLAWFTNIGKYLLAHSNTVPAVHGTGCFMSSHERTMVVASTSYTNSSVEFAREDKPAGGGVLKRSTRIVSGATSPNASVPFIDADRLSVVGALFAQRFMRR